MFLNEYVTCWGSEVKGFMVKVDSTPVLTFCTKNNRAPQHGIHISSHWDIRVQRFTSAPCAACMLTHCLVQVVPVWMTAWHGWRHGIRRVPEHHPWQVWGSEVWPRQQRPPGAITHLRGPCEHLPMSGTWEGNRVFGTYAPGRVIYSLISVL